MSSLTTSKLDSIVKISKQTTVANNPTLQYKDGLPSKLSTDEIDNDNPYVCLADQPKIQEQVVS